RRRRRVAEGGRGGRVAHETVGRRVGEREPGGRGRDRDRIDPDERPARDRPRGDERDRRERDVADDEPAADRAPGRRTAAAAVDRAAAREVDRDRRRVDEQQRRDGRERRDPERGHTERRREHDLRRYQADGDGAHGRRGNDPVLADGGAEVGRRRELPERRARERQREERTQRRVDRRIQHHGAKSR